MKVAKCRNCGDYIKFEPRIRFLRTKPTGRDISGGSWRHDMSRCRAAQPADGRLPIADVGFHSEYHEAWSQAINGGNNPDIK